MLEYLNQKEELERQKYQSLDAAPTYHNAQSTQAFTRKERQIPQQDYSKLLIPDDSAIPPLSSNEPYSKQYLNQSISASPKIIKSRNIHVNRSIDIA